MSVAAASEQATDAGSTPIEPMQAPRSAPRTIVLVGPLPPPSGGMANQTRQLAELLAAEGCDVKLVQNNCAYLPSWIAHVRGVRALFRLVPFAAELWRAMDGAELAHVMANSGWAWHLFATPAVWIASLRGVPVLINYRGGNAETFLRRQVALVRPTLARAAILIVPSGYLHTVFARHAIASSIVPNIVNLEAFQPAASRPRQPHILVTRNLDQIYDIGTAIRAFAHVRREHPDARMTVAGSGTERAALERLARQLALGEAVRFTGQIDNTLLPDLYRAASVVLNPSRVDNMPNSLLEAMASGVPVVSTNVGGVPYLVEDEHTALLVRPGDARAMADAVVRLHSEPELAERLRAAALRAVSCYAWPRVRATLFEVYARARDSMSQVGKAT